MTKLPAPPATDSALQKVLEGNLRALIAAQADRALIEQYSRLLSFVKKHGLDGLERKTRKPSMSTRLDSRIPPKNVLELPLEELLRFVTDESVPRKQLEVVAADRFGVPRGSMRSFSNRRMLVDKLRTLIRNEQAHATIRNLAKSDPK